MHVRPSQQVAQQPVTMEGAQGCTVRWLVGAAEGAPNFAMRKFEVAPGGFTPRHQHPYEHEVFILSGSGEVFSGDTPHALRAGDVVYVGPDEVHQFRNTGAEALEFLCLVPNSAMNQTPKLAPECGTQPLNPGEARDSAGSSR